MTNTPPTGTTPAPTVVDTSVATTVNTVAQNNYNLAVQNSTLYLTQMNEQVANSNSVLDLMQLAIGKGSAAINRMGDSINTTFANMANASDLTASQMTGLSVAITAAVGAGTSFNNMNFSHVNTFAGQINGLVDQVKGSNAGLTILANTLGLMIPSSLRDATDGLANFIKNTANSADNSIKLEDVYVRLAARTGELGRVHEAAGGDLEHMNQLVMQQRSAINQTIVATNLSKDTVEAYYAQLKELPTQITAGASATDNARGSTDALTKTIQLARGSGRDYKDVLDDMHLAIRNYNADLPQAMEFTARISEISAKYNIELDDVRKSLTGTADAFKMFGNEAEGANNILNQYVGSLKGTGLSGAVATDIVSNMTRQIGQLTIAQKGFLSAQSGGPGGLMGSFAIDMKLREGKLDEVFNMVKNQMTKMMGNNLVSTKEAENSPQAAAQMTRQIMMLRQGPLGQFARSDQEAERIIDAFKTGSGVDVKKLSLDPVKAAADLGNKYAEQTATGISQLVALAEEAKGVASGGNVNLLQGGFAARAGSELENQNLADVQARQGMLRDTMTTGAKRVGQPASNYNLITDAVSMIKDIPTELRSALQGTANQFKNNGVSNTSQLTEQDLQAQMAARKSQMPQINMDDLNKALSDNTAEVVGSAASTVAARKSPTVAPGTSTTAPNPTNAPSNQNRNGEITVHVEGMCINCGEKMKGSTQRLAVAPQTRGN
jgi:hypothetical protein